jgi:WD40 repeat protein
MGLSKGSVIMLHMIQLDRVFSRFTIHRDEIKLIKYLPNVCVFVSFCREKYFKIWRCLEKERKPQIIHSFRISKDVQNCIIFSKREESTRERFLLIFKTGDSELFEFDSSDDKLYWLESSKDREHDCPLTGVDFNKKL